jgi:hypothetical protein
MRMSGVRGQPLTKRISATIKASRTRRFTDFISSSQPSFGSGSNIPVMIPWVYESKLYPTAHPAALNAMEISCAKFNDSWSFISTENLTDAPDPLFLNANTKDSCSFWLNLRQALAARSFSVSRSAFAARLFDLSRSSVCIRLFNMPNKTSPTMPIATSASVMAEILKKVLYGGSTQAMISSAITAPITNAPHQIPHFSHEEDASSNIFSAAAFIVPRGRYHAGKNRLRTFLIAVVIVLAMNSFLFWMLGVLG